MENNERKPRFNVGMTWQAKRFPKAKELTEYTILNIYTTKSEAGNTIRFCYLVAHDFLGQCITEELNETSIIRSMTDNFKKELIL